MRYQFAILIVAIFISGCGEAKKTTNAPAASTPDAPVRQEAKPAQAQPAAPAQSGKRLSLVDAKKEFTSRITRKVKANEPVETPPSDVFTLTKYTSPAGELAAYVSPDPKDGKRHPAIVWITGGDCNTIGDVWSEYDPKNEQTASAYRKAGIVMMFPSLRGGNQNASTKEGFLGEVDDVIAAREYLATLAFVDPDRIYLGGHSTGGTMALLVAESTAKFRAVFSFGPAHTVAGYAGAGDMIALPFNMSDKRELVVRAPVAWLEAIDSPTYVIEGSQGNYDSLLQMQKVCKNSKVQFVAVKNQSHFTVLDPINKMIAEQILKDTGPETNLKITEAEVARLFKR